MHPRVPIPLFSNPVCRPWPPVSIFAQEKRNLMCFPGCLGFWPVTGRRANSGRFCAFDTSPGSECGLGMGEPHYSWCLTPVGPCGRLIAWPAGACVHRLPHGCYLAHFEDSLSMASLGTALFEGRVSPHLTGRSCDSPSSHQFFWLCLVNCEPEINLRLRTMTVEAKPKVLGICRGRFCVQFIS